MRIKKNTYFYKMFFFWKKDPLLYSNYIVIIKSNGIIRFFKYLIPLFSANFGSSLIIYHHHHRRRHRLMLF